MEDSTYVLSVRQAGTLHAGYPEKMENKDGYKDGYKNRSNKDSKYKSRHDHKH
jgi:hypothetical protein